jgi:nucleotide-binding universal stress UspA family protein
MYTNILVAVDVDDPTESAEALATATTLADCFGSELTICSVVRDLNVIAHGQSMPISYEQLLFETRSKLDTLSHSMGKATAPDVEVGTGTICGGVLEVADRISADLIVLASHRPGVVDYLHAANAARIARRARCSVLVVRAHSASVASRPTVQRRRPKENLHSRKSPEAHRANTVEGNVPAISVSEKHR